MDRHHKRFVHSVKVFKNQQFLERKQLKKVLKHIKQNYAVYCPSVLFNSLRLKTERGNFNWDTEAENIWQQMIKTIIKNHSNTMYKIEMKFEYLNLM